MTVGALDEGVLVGRVQQVLVEPSEMKVVGLLIREKGLFGKFKVISILDLIDVEPAAVVINSRQNLVEEKEIVRIGKILKYKFNLIGLPAMTKSMKILGKVTDAVIDSQSGEIVRLYTRYFLQNRVFARSQIEKITWKEIILSVDERKKIKAKDTVPTEVAPEISTS